MFVASYNLPMDNDGPESDVKPCKTRREALNFLRDAYRCNGPNRFLIRKFGMKISNAWSI